MGSRGVVFGQGISGLVEGNGTAIDAKRSADEEDALTFDDVGPVDEDDGFVEVLAELVTEQTIKGEPLTVQMTVGE